MPIPKTSGKVGFTLTELLVVVSITAIIGGSLISLFITSQSLFPLVSARQELIYETNQALNRAAELLTQTGLDQFEITDIGTSGNYRIRFSIPFVVDGQVQVDANGQIEWGSINYLNGYLEIGYVTPVQAAYLDYQHTTILVWKDNLADLIIPAAYAQLGEEDRIPRIPLVLEEYNQNGELQDQHTQVLSTQISGVQFNFANERIEINMQAERTDWRGRTINVVFTTQVKPRN